MVPWLGFKAPHGATVGGPLNYINIMQLDKLQQQIAAVLCVLLVSLIIHQLHELVQNEGYKWPLVK